jgi:uroporphyrinogen decarboxylase
METSRQRVLNAINHVQPEVTPVNLMGFGGMERWLRRFGAADYVDLRLKLGLDLIDVRPVYVGPNAALGRDIWGVPANWGGAEGAGYGRSRGGFPLAEATSVREIESYPWPDPDQFDYAVVGRELAALPADKAKWVRANYVPEQEGLSHEQAARGGGSAWLPLLCTLFNLFGMEKTLLHIAAEPALIEAAVARIEAFTLEFCRRLFSACGPEVDIFWYGDDFAAQRGMIISPQQFRRFLKPTYQKVFALAKGRGLKVWVHACGAFRPVLTDLIDIGMDVWETVQVHLPGNEPRELKRGYGKNLTFFGAVSTQNTLPKGTVAQVRAEVRDRIAVLGQGGGYICGGDHTIMPDVPIDNVLAMIDEARKFRF